MAKSPLRKRRWGWLIWLALLAAGIYGVRRWSRSRRTAATSVRVHRVVRGNVRDLVSTLAAGRLAAEREATVRAEIAGTVLRLHHRRGELVHAGDLIVSYDNREMVNRVRAAQAALVLTRAQTAQARASAELANANRQRAQGLAQRGVTPTAEVETLARQHDIAVSAVRTAQTGAVQGGANIALARDALRRAEVRAPFDGVLLTTNVEQGEVTVPGAPLFSIADVSRLHVDGELDESDMGRVEVHMPAEVSFDAFVGQRFRGRLEEIAPSVTRDLRGNRSVSIRVSVLPDARLRVGMSADVDVVVATRENVIFVPPNAVLGRGTDRAVMVVDRGVARRRRIDVGVATWEAVEVRSGLRPADVVILSATDLADGAPVTLRPDNGHAPAAPTR